MAALTANPNAPGGGGGVSGCAVGGWLEHTSVMEWLVARGGGGGDDVDEGSSGGEDGGHGEGDDGGCGVGVGDGEVVLTEGGWPVVVDGRWWVQRSEEDDDDLCEGALAGVWAGIR
ncbi:hypothetical protein Tco_0826675 [Tanacetum coccineum]